MCVLYSRNGRKSNQNPYGNQLRDAEVEHGPNYSTESNKLQHRQLLCFSVCTITPIKSPVNRRVIASVRNLRIGHCQCRQERNSCRRG